MANEKKRLGIFYSKKEDSTFTIDNLKSLSSVLTGSATVYTYSIEGRNGLAIRTDCPSVVRSFGRNMRVSQFTEDDLPLNLQFAFVVEPDHVKIVAS